VDEPYFLLNVLELINARLVEENDSALIAVYAVNQKGRSAGVIIRDLELGATVELDRGERRMQTKLAAFSRPTFPFPRRPRESDSRQLTGLDAVLHRHRRNHPHRVSLHCIQTAVHLLDGKVAEEHANNNDASGQHRAETQQ
jgi:hypothetical protein